MTSRHLLDPELEDVVAAPLLDRIDADRLPGLRAALTVPLTDAEHRGVERSEVRIPGPDDAPLRCLLYRRAGATAPQPAYLHIHGGGYILGSPEMADASNLDIAARLDAVVLSVDYRLAPEHPAPAGLEDCFAALAWLHDQAGALGIDPARIAIGGESAGGGLAAALALHARDDGRYPVCHQHLTYPMLDDRTGSDIRPGDPLVGEFIWTRTLNRFGWNSYVGDQPARAPWVPARADDLAGLPRTWLFTGTLDLFRDEDIAYAQRLMAAGVPTDLIVYAGACHGFPRATGAWVTQRFVRDHRAALARALGVVVRDD